MAATDFQPGKELQIVSGTPAQARRRGRFRALVLAGATVALGGALLAGPANVATAAPADKLAAGKVMVGGQTLKSANGKYLLAMQTDGNLVLYSGRTALWHTQTGGNKGSRLAMQTDGNLVIYNAAKKPIWHTNSHGNSGAFLAVQNDANVVVYTKTGKPLWDRVSTTSTLRPGDTLPSGRTLNSQNRQYLLAMQKDGNLVLYRGKAVMWHTGSAPNPGVRLVMQLDGNLVMYTTSNRAIRSTNTHGNPGAFLAVQDDGNLVIYSKTKKPLWWSKR
jgi:hypothetical protein